MVQQNKNIFLPAKSDYIHVKGKSLIEFSIQFETENVRSLFDHYEARRNSANNVSSFSVLKRQ